MNNWVNFVKQFAEDNELSYSDALKVAKKYYKKPNSNRRNTPTGAKPCLWLPAGAGLTSEKEMYGIGRRIGEILGGADSPKGALAALLSGLNAHISVE